jgi:hypothetical protein
MALICVLPPSAKEPANEPSTGCERVASPKASKESGDGVIRILVPPKLKEREDAKNGRG